MSLIFRIVLQFQLNMALSLGYDPSTLKTSGPDSEEIQANIQTDYARVDVYYQTLNVRSIVQNPMYPVKNCFTSLRNIS